MSEDKETPERRREKLRQEELKRNPSSSVHGGGLADLIGSYAENKIKIFTGNFKEVAMESYFL
ncbi:DUF6366 family protein [Peribacillus simplex]|uniref:DUF6366 family protein n=2 Tax=Peribacillus TaxID=2675229 RepID=A0AA90P4L3_9BACI|nr:MULTISPECIES: DUF6366 family protein [Peribacillus]MDP1420608.1 DUF6366 family protein [Peribacillus simplex]MDP1453519.1 DUF6366 family protein [Peribacillus frigoritolerans]